MNFALPLFRQWLLRLLNIILFTAVCCAHAHANTVTSNSAFNTTSPARPDIVLTTLLVFSLIYIVLMRMGTFRTLKSALLVFLSTCLAAGPTLADVKTGLYLGIGGSVTRLTPEVRNAELTDRKSMDIGWQATLGYQLTPTLSTELEYADLGTTELRPLGSISYQDINLSGLYHLGGVATNWNDRKFSLFGKLGIGTILNQSDIELERGSDVHLLLGAGVQLPMSERLTLRAEAVRYDTDVSRAGLTVLYKLGPVTARGTDNSVVATEPAETDTQDIIDTDYLAQPEGLTADENSAMPEELAVNEEPAVPDASAMNNGMEMTDELLIGEGLASSDDMALDDNMVEASSDAAELEMSAITPMSESGTDRVNSTRANELLAVVPQARPSAQPSDQSSIELSESVLTTNPSRTIDADSALARLSASEMSLGETAEEPGIKPSDDDLLSMKTGSASEQSKDEKDTKSALDFDAVPVLFDFDSTAITAFYKDKLQPLLKYLSATPTASVTLTGHTDNIGSESYNEMLSIKRAEAVREFLLQQGIDRKMIRIAGAGEKRPEKSNAKPSGRKANRRVSIAVH